MTRCKDSILNALLATLTLLLLSLFGCGEDEETPVETVLPSPETLALTPQEIAQTALQSTVFLQVKKPENQITSASGFVVGEGLIVTSYHIAENMLTGSTARLVNSALMYSIEAIAAVDKPHDLAVLKVTGISAPLLPLGDSDTVRVGDTVYVTGNPKGYLGTFSVGHISAIQKGDSFVADKVIQMTAPISKGSSGGPVLNARGAVIGVVSGGDTAGQNLNFATPVNFLKQLLNTL